MNPNHYLAVAISYLYGGARPGWQAGTAIGKTLVSSSLIDRVAGKLGARLLEVPVGFKWFVPGLVDGSVGFGGEESAGASFLRTDGTVWTTDKDGMLPALLASEILATTGKSPSAHHRDLVAEFGESWYARVDAVATREEKATLAKLTPSQVTATTLAGEEITARLTEAPGNGASIGGLKVTTKNAWFAARPSGTEDVYKIYAESFVSAEHLAQVQAEAKDVVSAALAGSAKQLGGPGVSAPLGPSSCAAPGATPGRELVDGQAGGTRRRGSCARSSCIGAQADGCRDGCRIGAPGGHQLCTHRCIHDERGRADGPGDADRTRGRRCPAGQAASGARPSPVNVHPAARQRAASSLPRASMTAAWWARVARCAGSARRNSSHSVSTSTTSAPVDGLLRRSSA